MIKVLVKQPGHPPFMALVQNDLEPLQKLVGGYIETVSVFEDMVIICNEEGRIMGLPYNCNLCGYDFVGPILLVGVDGEEFDDVPLSYETAKMLFPELWEV